MSITRVSDYAFQNPGVWLASTLIALVLVAILGWLLLNGDIDGGPGVLVIAFFPALLGTMVFFHLHTEPVSVYEGKVTSVSGPTHYRQYPVLITTMEGVDEKLYVINRGDAREMVKASDAPSAFLCEPKRRVKSYTTDLMCDPLEDEPGSKELEEFKAGGL